MRIGISSLMIQRGRTGIAQYLFGLLRAFQIQGGPHRFVVYTLEDDLDLFSFAAESAQLVPVAERYRPPIQNIWWHQSQLPVQARRDGLDVLHVPSYRRLLWRKPCPLVATIHDLAPFRVPKKYDWKRMLYGRVLARVLARRQDAFIAVSENTACDLGTFFRVPPDKLSVVHNGIDHDRFFPGSRPQAKSAVAARHQLLRPYFLYVARLEHPGKNHVRLIKAFEAFKTVTRSEWQLVFGGSDWHGAQAIQSAAGQSPFAADIRMPGFVPDNQLPDLYRAAEALVYPSLFEGFGLPPVEAMACGCPVICSPRGALGEVVGDAAALVDPEDVGSMARQLAAVAGSETARDKLRSAGLVRARRFNWLTTARETLRVYERAAGARCRASAGHGRVSAGEPAQAFHGSTD